MTRLRPAGPGPHAIARLLTRLNRSGAAVVPLSLGEALSTPVSDAVHALWGDKRGMARRNYARVLGLPEDDPRVEATARECFRQFGRYITEIIAVQGWGTEDVLDLVEIIGGRHLEEAAALGKGVVFVSAHMGSTEVAASLVVLKGFRVTSVTERIRPDWLMEYIVESRRRMGISLLPASGAGIGLIRELRRGGMIAFLVDAGVDRAGSIPVRFFGAETLFPEGPARLARMTGAPLVFAMAARKPGGRYVAHVCPPIESNREVHAERDIAGMTQALANTFENFVRRYPGQWYAFRRMWPD
jgi:KDO2-lipid IV(A) lauroyltransferase